jgi:uncharacterized membrane protein
MSLTQSMIKQERPPRPEPPPWRTIVGNALLSVALTFTTWSIVSIFIIEIPFLSFLLVELLVILSFKVYEHFHKKSFKEDVPE